jgi:predicted nucleic acid-binding protein
VTYYADTSWWLNFLLVEVTNHAAATRIFRRDPDARVLWTPWQRVEVFNGLYQLERAGSLPPGNGRRVISQLEMEVRLGYWPHQEFSWTDAVRRACQLAEQHGPNLRIRAMDLFQVAVALTVRAQAFLSFDSDQNALARAAGLNLA